MTNRARVTNLIAERDRAQREGNEKRVAEVEAELRKLGDQAEPPAKKAARRGG